MKKRIILMLGLLFVSITVFCQPTNGEIADILAKFGLSPAIAGIIVAVAAVVVGKVVPNKWADIFHLITLMFIWLDDHTNRQSPAQKAEKAKLQLAIKKAKGIIPMLLIGILLTAFNAPTSAQSAWNGFLKPVPSDLLKPNLAKGEIMLKSGDFKWRPVMGFVASGVRLSQVEGELFTTFPVIKTGVGASYAHYVPNDEGLPVNNYTINAMLLLPMTEAEQTMGLAVGVSAFNINAGAGIDFLKNTAFKYMIFAFIGAEYTF